MKLTVKTLKGSHFEIRVQPSDTVMAVKKNIEDVQGKDNYPCGQQLLIHNGKVLKDETTLVENKVSEDGFLVVMLSKSKASGSSAAPSVQFSFSVLNMVKLCQPASSPATTVSTSNSNPAPDPPVQTQAANNSTSSTDAPITNFCQLKFSVVHVWIEKSLFFCVPVFQKGIPEPAEVAVPVPNYPGSQTTETAGIPSGAVPVGPNSSPLNMFPQFQALRSMVQSNPQILQPVLQELGKQNPGLLRMIQEHHGEFLQLINEPVDGSEGDIFDQPEQDMPHAINVTPAEQEAIGRLEAMGFDRASVIEAFLACDRDEQLAANYLLENAGDFED
ncbi:Ubiquitin receptor [Vigna angularis]|uniref:Ubiquitin receptor RAD23 n=1 Tax=Phaseolus angularis TaxID=3914 RepID=A0A8T0JP93_PHAAN|nr:Ubiquitin receptor [Vigna angularis]